MALSDKSVKLKCGYDSDIYILIPYSSNSCGIMDFHVKDTTVSKRFIDLMNKTSLLECSTDVCRDLKRIYVGKCNLACFNDLYDGVVEAKEEFDMFFTIDEVTGIYLLTLMNLNNSFSTTQIQDQVSSNNLFICDQNNIVRLDDFINEKYGLIKCGDAKVLISLSAKPKSDLEFLCMLAGEAYDSKIDYSLKSNEILDMSKHNFSQYDFYEIYASKNSVVYILNELNDSEELSINEEAPILFIMELIMFQNASVLRTNKSIVSKLSGDGKVSLKDIENLYIEFGKTIKFWSNERFKYLSSQIVAEHINRSFETQKVLDDYYNNQNFLEHIVNLRDVQNSNREGRILNIVVIFLTILQVIPILIQFYDYAQTGVYSNNLINYVGLGIVFILVIILFIKNRNTKKKQKSLK